MDDLIKALTIFQKYASLRNPTHCEHDVMFVVGVGKTVTAEDAIALDALGFLWMDEYDSWGSFRFGSA